MIELVVELGDRSYPVLVGPRARHRLAEVLPEGVQRVAIVTQANIKVDVDPGVPYETFYVPNGEVAKELETVEELTRGFARMGLTRKDCVVAVGGGVVTDLGGFSASLYHRGIKVVHVATTLLAQVCASIGGKNAVNLPEGKNLIGTFWQPSAVLCDTATLETLPPREYLSGTGEMAKYHFFGSQFGVETKDMLDIPLDDRVARCVRIKSTVVALDEREGGLRAILNYGHTLAHALESAGHFDLRHGEAVGIGIYYAALLAQHLGRIDQSRVDDHLKILRSYSLPTDLPTAFNEDELITLMGRDKKALSGLTFMLDGANGVEVFVVDEADVRATLSAMPRA